MPRPAGLLMFLIYLGRRRSAQRPQSQFYPRLGDVRIKQGGQLVEFRFFGRVLGRKEVHQYGEALAVAQTDEPQTLPGLGHRRPGHPVAFMRRFQAQDRLGHLVADAVQEFPLQFPDLGLPGPRFPDRARSAKPLKRLKFSRAITVKLSALDPKRLR